MTKPHTTLSEAVRALPFDHPDYKEDSIGKAFLESGFKRGLAAAAELVEKAEEEKPIDRAIRTGEPELFSFAPDQSSVRVVWPNGEVSLYVAESAEGQEPVAWIIYAEHQGAMIPQYPAYFDKKRAENEAKLFGQNKTEVHALYTQPTLAATQAADAARYRWLRERDWFDGELCVLRDPKKVLTSGYGLGADCPSRDRLDAAIDAAMSPTTTRSE